MVKIYGASDDLVEIDGSAYEEEIGCFEQDVRIRFLDGTIIHIGYPKENMAIWWIEVENEGTAKHALTICENEDDCIYSDVFEIDSEIKSHRLIKQKFGGNETCQTR